VSSVTNNNIKPANCQAYSGNLPYSPEAEQSVLGTVLIDETALEKIKELKPTHFHVDLHAGIFGCIKKLKKAGETIDVIKVIEKCTSSGTFDDQIEARAYIVKLAESVVNPSSVGDHAKIIIDNYRKRTLLKKAAEITMTGSVDPDSLTELSKAIDAVKMTTSKPLLRCAVDIVEILPEYLWENVFIKGALNSVQGLAGIGKSFLLCAIAAAVSSGGVVQGVSGNMERVEKGRVLYLSGDDAPEMLKGRLSGFNANMSNIFFGGENIFPIGSTEMSDMFEQIHPVLAILDTLQHFLPKKTDINAANEASVAVQPLKALAEQYNAAVVVIQHINKISANNGGGHSVTYGIGSGGINGLFRSVYTLGRLKEEDGKPSPVRVLASSKTNYVAGDVPAIKFTLTQEEGFLWAGVDANIIAEDLYCPIKRGRGRPAEQVERAEEIITDMLNAHGGEMLSSELLKAVLDEGISERTYKTARGRAGVISYWKDKQNYTRVQKNINGDNGEK